MTTSAHLLPLRPGQLLVWTLMALTAAAGAWLSFDFGARIGGALMGLVAAFNGALMCLLLTGTVVDAVARVRRHTAARRA